MIGQDKLTSRSDSHCILRCTTCKTVGRRDYTAVMETTAYLGRPHHRQWIEIGGRSWEYRTRPDLQRLLQGPCPSCRSDRVEVRLIKGNYVEDKPCDGRCMNAIGPSCSCSCGGKNHGRGNAVWVVETP